MAHSFAAEPRAVGPRGKQLYRSETDLSGARLNLMADPRVYRGSNYSAHNAPSANQAADQQQQPAAAKPRRPRPRRKESKSVFDLVPVAKQRVMIDLAEHLVERAPEINEADATSQTDVFRPRPPSPPYVPRKTGVDASTQIEEADGLFDFDEEVAPLLNVLVGKTLEQGLLEVLEEEELRVLRERKQAHLQARADEAARVRAVEEEERRLWVAKQQRRQREGERVAKEETVRRKVQAAQFARSVVRDAEPAAMAAAAAAGAFADDVPLRVETQFLPSLYDLVQQNVDRMQTARIAVDAAMRAAFHKQKQAQAIRELTFAAAEAQLVPQKRLPEPVPEGYISIYIDAAAIGIADDEAEDGMLGPIPVPETEPLDKVEEAIVGWLGRNILDEEFEAPEAGFLLSFGGREIAPDKTLVDLDVTDRSELGVAPR